MFYEERCIHGYWEYRTTPTGKWRPGRLQEPLSAPGRHHYAKRDHMELADYYTRHVSAMTAEGLHAKSDIAAELAWRDRKIDRLQALARGPQQEGGEDVIRGLAGIAHSHRHLSAAPIKAIELITALQAEVARLRGMLNVAVEQARLHDEEQQASLREAQANDRRYRWLRKRVFVDRLGPAIPCGRSKIDADDAARTDAAIDSTLNGGQDDA